MDKEKTLQAADRLGISVYCVSLYNDHFYEIFSIYFIHISLFKSFRW